MILNAIIVIKYLPVIRVIIDIYYLDVINLLLKLDEKHTQDRIKTETEISELKNTIIDLQSKIKFEPTNITNSNNTINVTNNNTTNNNNIIFKFGSKIDHNLISTEKLLHFLNQGAHKTVPLMVEEIHCNINNPQYHSIYIPDKRSKDAIIYDGKQFKTVFLNETLDYLDSNMKTHITDRFNLVEGLFRDQERFRKKFSEEDMNNIVKRLRKLNDLEVDDPEQIRSIQLIRYLLCDYRETVKDTRKRFEKKIRQRKLASTELHKLEGTN